ncbi:ABC transporter ATP-binding protein [Clostridium sporogenes]|uniref:ABC transporter ATP-binding protein n=1 Tax=Clostridium sporogenes TaxID=1509 RepID=A0A7X5P6C6_CLOSG|nr:ABC transporter ATP-binding protein [Clostridium sporogenes]AJD31099.1 ABC transporter family protein [Clostridium botulinum Prevot_594]MBW5456346.1 ATP-binding cassette domain-containing protein [Clostridium sporogenes]NFG04140.1 ABC transporter ATP-binding protein [Clostridium sporogenes]NFH45762.1 ABC transporter ATP-binding protein [Clostridium sporogenes]NFQ17796.1 ABC transporter ATP-binding protein [Clostridium sporogenes]
MISISNVSKMLGDKKALNNINLDIEKGSIFGVIGENGAGKTTLIKCMLGIYKQDEGEIKVDGKPVFENTLVKGKIGYVAAEIQYYSSFKVKELVKFYTLTYSTFSYERFKELNKIFKIPENKRIRELSKGMKMRVSLMLNLSIYPEILILDEPTSGLDPIIKRKLINILLEEVSERNTTIFIASHHLDDLERICDSVAIIEKGKIKYANNIEDMKKYIKKLQVLFKDENKTEEIKAWDEIMTVENVGRINYLITNNYSDELQEKLIKSGAEFVEEIDLSLEDMFIYSMEGGKENEKLI